MFDFDKYSTIKADLNLKLPVTLTLSDKPNKDADAYYVPRFNNKGILTSHKITIFITSCARDIDTLITHELIHAWQQENNKMEFHGKYFRQWADFMHVEHNIYNVYIRGTDKK